MPLPTDVAYYHISRNNPSTHWVPKNANGVAIVKTSCINLKNKVAMKLSNLRNCISFNISKRCTYFLSQDSDGLDYRKLLFKDAHTNAS